MANRKDEHHMLTQTVINTKVAPDVHNILQSLPMNSSEEKKNKFIMIVIIYIYLGRDSKRHRTVSQPEGTTLHTVSSTDTLEKVALHFNSTPSALVKLNKLNTRTLYPGQILFVPNESSSNNSNQQQSTIVIPSVPPDTTSSSSPTQNKDGDAFVLLKDNRSSSVSSPSSHHPLQKDVGPMVWSMTRNITARPGHAERLKSDPTVEEESSSNINEDRLKTSNEDNSKQVKMLQRSLSIDKNHRVDDECLQRFIKVNVRLMTEDHESVAGTLLVTPNAVMFDPDVLDPLVKEHGIEKYGLIIRMDYLAGISLYEDLAMYEHEATFHDEEKRKMYHSTSVKNFQYSLTHPTMDTDEEEIHDLMSCLLDKIDKELNPSSISNETCMLFNAASTIKRQMSLNSSDNNYNDETFLPTSTNDNFLDDSLQFSNDILQPLDDYKHSIGILLDDDNDKNVNINFHRIPSQGCVLKNHVSLDQFNKRFGEIDELLRKQQENYFAPHRIEIPYYLCIKTSIHTHDIPSLHARQYKKHSEKFHDTIYGRKHLKYEYWFSVPKEKTGPLYSFFLRWTPERALDPLIDDDKPLSNIHPTISNNQSPNKGFVLFTGDDPQLPNDYANCENLNNHTKTNDQQKRPHYLSRQNTLLKDWEVNLNIYFFNDVLIL
ncbi:unnamed protein product [Rotaria sp. Silwood2]|nr:unnamed protein product [Rotaria sp. Silwood2]CAF4116047.1 unnamed protein product [Rotaria sp. Silwood2]CAF4119885.1 unnamed protein product [Rotaria sp. Silwood2]